MAQTSPSEGIRNRSSSSTSFKFARRRRSSSSLSLSSSQDGAAAAARSFSKFSRCSGNGKRQRVRKCASAHHRGSGSSSLRSVRRSLPPGQRQQQSVSLFRGRAKRALLRPPRHWHPLFQSASHHWACRERTTVSASHHWATQRLPARTTRNHQRSEASKRYSPVLPHSLSRIAKARRRRPLAKICGSCVRRQNRTKQNWLRAPFLTRKGTRERLT